MNGPATHFAPTVKIPPAGHAGVPLISAMAVAGVPDWVRQTFGEKVLTHANQAAMLDLELIEDQDCFIPQEAMFRFLHSVEWHGGVRHMGLMIVPHLSFAIYGTWADYVTSAPTLGAALDRACASLRYHSIGDRLTLRIRSGQAHYCYFNALRGRPGYEHVAVGTSAVLRDLLRVYLGPAWQPRLISLDIPRPRSDTPFEDGVGCPVAFESRAVILSFDAALLSRQRPGSTDPRLLGYEDLRRLRFDPAGLVDFEGTVFSQIWTQLLAGNSTIDATAGSMGTSTRSLQRELNRVGTDFRSLLAEVRVQRARELLRETSALVTEIAVELGYSSSANFARAFRRSCGMAPEEYRLSVLGGD